MNPNHQRLNFVNYNQPDLAVQNHHTKNIDQQPDYSASKYAERITPFRSNFFVNIKTGECLNIINKFENDSVTYPRGSLEWPEPGQIYVVSNASKKYCKKAAEMYHWHLSNNYLLGRAKSIRKVTYHFGFKDSDDSDGSNMATVF